MEVKANRLVSICSAILFSVVGLAQTSLDDEGFQFSLSGGYSTKGIPVNIAYEMAVHEDFTGGIRALYRIYNEKTDTASFNHSIMGLVFFGNYYFNQLLNLDEDDWGIYGGINFGYYKWFSPAESLELGKSSSTLGAGVQLGGRYYMKNFGIFLEIQASSENVGGQLGITYRIPY